MIVRLHVPPRGGVDELLLDVLAAQAIRDAIEMVTHVEPSEADVGQRPRPPCGSAVGRWPQGAPQHERWLSRQPSGAPRPVHCPFTWMRDSAGVQVASPARRAAYTAGQAVSTALARRARSYPAPQFARDGYLVRPRFLAAADAAAAARDLERFADPAVKQTGVAGSTLRDRADRQARDLNVRQLADAHLLSPTLRALAASGRIEQTMHELTGLTLSIGRFSVQIDWPDTETKRGLHVDSHWPPTYKAFVYLTPVLGPENGPFSVVPGSHRHRLRKVTALAGNYLRGRDRTDLDGAYSLGEARCLLGGPGTAIFADQRLAHAGWPGHTTGTRFMLVAYLYERPALRR